MRSRLSHSDALTSAEHSKLSTLVDDCEQRLRGVTFTLPLSVIHGDASVGNIIRAETGQLVLFDLEGVCEGPAEWDLIITAVYRELGWHTGDEYRDFVRTYGFDVSQWDGY